jgi:integrase
MGNYKGISTKKMKDGSFAIMARFKHEGITYPIKNLTKLYGCKTETEGFKKLSEIKLLLSQGKDPFSSSDGTLKELFERKIELNLKNDVWAKSTIKNYKYFFYKHIDKAIGKKNIEKIKYEDIMNILNTFKHNQTSSKNQVIDTLRPIFKEEYKKGNLLEDIMLKVDKYRANVQREDLSKRTNHNYTEIIRGLYNSVPLYDQAHEKNIEQHKIFLYMILLTAHRYGEVSQLEKKHCDIKNRKIVAPKTINKSRNIDYHYPIPDECFEFIKNAPDGKLFNVPRGGTSGRVFHRLLMKAKIETIDNHSISMHDTRKLMLSIMITKLNIDSRLADYCLEHKQQGTIKHYLEFTYEDKVKAYEKYWNYVRDNIIENKSEILVESKNDTDNTSNFEKLKELVEMHKKGYLTKEQFELERDRLF